MRPCGTFLICAVVLLASSCGPYLRRIPLGSEQIFEASARCSQGPLVLQVRATGARWGEFATFRVVSPRALVGRYRVFVDGKPDLHGAWRTVHSVPAENNSTRDVADEAPANAACVERPVVLVEAEPVARVEHAAPIVEATAEPEWAPLPATPEAGGGGVTAEGTLAGTIEVGGSTEVTLVPTQERRPGKHHATIVFLSRRTEDREAPPPFAEGALIRIELWSEVPNDYAGVRFEAERGAYVPSSSEAEWFAELDKREADEIREQHHRTFDQRKENEQRRREADAKRQRCREDATRSECAPPPARVHVAPRPRPRPAPTAASVPPVVVPQPRPPTAPPPPPRQSMPTATVSYATWVPGFWEWSGFEWVWLDGWWKVDEQRRAAAARQATIACPAPRVEAAPPQPMVGATWQGGVWAWAGVAWQWVPGAWRLSARSQPAHPAVPVTPQPAPR